MTERLYTTYPEIDDALYREIKDYDMEVQFIVDQFEMKNQPDSTRMVFLGW